MSVRSLLVAAILATPAVVSAQRPPAAAPAAAAAPAVAPAAAPAAAPVAAPVPAPAPAPAVVPDTEVPPMYAPAVDGASDDTEVVEESPRPRRSGFTIEGSIGLGFTRFSPDQAAMDGVTETGLAGLNLGLGGFVGPNTALTLRIAGTSYSTDASDVQVVAGFVGPTIQQWVNDRFFLGAGAGIAFLNVSGDGSDGSRVSGSEEVFGLDLRAGVDIVTGRTGALHLALEVTPGFYEGGTITGIGLQLGAQLF
jgi:hypothetical protein